VNASGTAITWTSYDLPTRITHTSGNSSTFEYGPDRGRIRQVALAGGETTETVYAAGGLYERVTRGGVTSQRNYIVADGRRVAVQTRAAGASPTTVYLLEDHLGGVDGFTSSTGALLSRTSNQPFGARRSGDWVGSTPTTGEWNQVKATTPRGFTDHEHVDNLGVIHMNGRVYDPVLARFLSPDPVVQAPYDSQAWNRYSYVRNNPLRYTDPTGFCFNGHPAADNAVQDCLRRIVETLYVQASRIPGYSVGSVVVGGDVGVGTGDFLAAGGMSGADAAFVAGGVEVPPPPADITPTEEVVVTDVRPPEPPFASVDLTLYAPPVDVGDLIMAMTIGIALIEPSPVGETVIASRVAESSGRALSTIRHTKAGEKFVRYESSNRNFSRVTRGGGVRPGTYAAPRSDGLVPVAERPGVYNLPDPSIPRTEVYFLEPPANTLVIGPRPVMGGTGNEVLFPWGFP
jgi:RHS repeat-associated protein